MQHGRQRDLGTDDRGPERGHAVLTLDADVEQAHLETDRGSEARYVIRRRIVERIDERIGAVDVAPHRVERIERVVSRKHEHDARHHNRDAERRERRPDELKELTAIHRVAPLPSRAPVMYEPSSPGVMWAGSRCATMRPL